MRVATSLDKAVVVAFVRRLWQPLQALRQWRHEELLRTGVGHLKAVVRLPLDLAAGWWLFELRHGKRCVALADCA